MAIFWKYIKGTVDGEEGHDTLINFTKISAPGKKDCYPSITYNSTSNENKIDLGNIVTTKGDTQTFTKGLVAPWINVNGLFKATQIQALYDKTDEDSIYANGPINGLSLKSRDGGTAQLYNVNCYNNTTGTDTSYSLNVHGTSYFKGQSSFKGPIEGSSGNFTGEVKGALGNFTDGTFNSIKLDGKDLNDRLNEMGFKPGSIDMPGATLTKQAKYAFLRMQAKQTVSPGNYTMSFTSNETFITRIYNTQSGSFSFAVNFTKGSNQVNIEGTARPLEMVSIGFEIQ